MSILLLGRWDWGGNLRIDGSHEVVDGDQEEIDRLVDGQGDPNSAWAVEFLVDTHREAVQLAYEEYVADSDGGLIDDVQGFEPGHA